MQGKVRFFFLDQLSIGFGSGGYFIGNNCNLCICWFGFVIGISEFDGVFFWRKFNDVLVVIVFGNFFLDILLVFVGVGDGYLYFIGFIIVVGQVERFVFLFVIVEDFFMLVIDMCIVFCL